MLTKYVVPGDRMELVAIKSDKEGSDVKEEKRVYRTKVYDVISDEEIRVYMPMEGGKLILLPIDGEFELCFYTQQGLFECYARVVDRYKSDNVYILDMILTTNIRKFQRREYYRLNCILDMKCRSIGASIEDRLKERISQRVEFLDTDFTLQDGVIVDISGGGARFVSSQKYDKDSYILFIFSLIINGAPVSYSVEGKVLFSDEIARKEGTYENRVQFVNLTNDDREGIIRYIFEEERKIRRKEKS